MGPVPDINELACTVSGLCAELELEQADATYVAGVIGVWAKANVPGFDWETWKASAIPNNQKG